MGTGGPSSADPVCVVIGINPFRMREACLDPLHGERHTDTNPHTAQLSDVVLYLRSVRSTRHDVECGQFAAALFLAELDAPFCLYTVQPRLEGRMGWDA